MSVCNECGEVFNGDEHGLFVRDSFTGQEHEFCFQKCLSKFMKTKDQLNKVKGG